MMFRDEGAEPSIRFKQRMRERVERTPTSIVVAAAPFVITIKLAVIAKHAFTKARLKSLARRIDASRDLRETIRPGECACHETANHVDRPA